MKKTIAIIFSIILTLLIGITIKSNAATQYDTLIWIDSPAENGVQYKIISVTGWVMSEYSNNEIKILIDNKEQKVDILRQ